MSAIYCPMGCCRDLSELRNEELYSRADGSLSCVYCAFPSSEESQESQESQAQEKAQEGN